MRKSGIHNFPAIDRVVYGKAAADALKDEAVRLDAKRVFLIVSRTLNTKTDEIEKIRRALGDKHVATFDGIAQHTTRKQAAEVARQANDAEADLIVAVGGGSAIDLAKIVIMAMEHDIRDEAGFDPFSMGPGVNFSPFLSPTVRQIAVPSTLNGGEYNAAALVTDERHKLKQIFFHPQMMPLAIILDPALTLQTPSKLWMGSGTRSMDHGIEALCSPAGTPLADEVVLAGIRICVRECSRLCSNLMTWRLVDYLNMAHGSRLTAYRHASRWEQATALAMCLEAPSTFPITIAHLSSCRAFSATTSHLPRMRRSGWQRLLAPRVWNADAFE